MSRSPTPHQLKDGRWRVVVQKGHGSREHRVRVYLSGSSEAAVNEKLKNWYRDQEEGRRPPDRRLTVGTYLRRWLDGLAVRERTMESYRGTIERHVLPRIGGVLLVALGPLDIDAMLVDMGKHGVKPATRAYALRVLSVALNVAVRRKRLIPYNPADGADRPVVKRRQPVLLSESEMARLAPVLESDRNGPLFQLLVTTVIRRGEALALRWSDWDREAGTLNISKTLLYRPGVGYEPMPPKTASSVRVIRLPLAAQVALRAQSRRQAAERLKAGRRWKDNDLVFTAQHNPGEPLNGSTVVHALHRLCEDAGVPVIRVHDLRHLGATIIVEAVGPAAAQAVLGHATPSMTARYTHLPATSQAAADAIDARFLPSGDAAVDAI